MKKMLLALVLCMALLTTAALADATVYTAAGNGYGGPVNVNVTIDEGKIIAVELGENNETNIVIDRSFPVIAERIVAANTADVDSVTAATFSSNAVKAAVADAMAQAGMEKPEISYKNAEKPATERAAETCDIVIVGGGPAGLAAGIGAKEVNPELNVIIVEKLDILSGNGKFDMNYFDLINSEAQKAAGTEKWINNQIENFIEYKSQSGESEARIKIWADAENKMDAWLRGMGVELNYNYGDTNHMAETDRYAGEAVQEGLEKRVFELGVDVRTGTKGMDLVMEDGACTGVIVTNNAGETYTINAKSIIIATGGFCYNKELVAKYLPGYEVLSTSNQMGATGDFIPVFEKNGFKLEQMAKPSVFANIIVPRRDLTGGADLNLLVNKDGALLPNKSGLDRYNQMKEQPDGATFYITDKTGYDSFYRIRKHVALGYYAEGATLAELAGKLGINAEGFEASVAQFNADAAAGAENAATAAVAKRAFDAEGPYYGVRVEPALHMTKGGVVANEKGQVLYADDTVVPNLYAAGEVCWQPGAYSASVSFGWLTGQSAAAAN